MKELEHKLLNVIKTNVAISAFNRSLVGMSVWLLIGFYDIPIYATILKLSGEVGGFISGSLEQKLSFKEDDEIVELNMKAEIVSLSLYSIGNIIITINFMIGIWMLILGRLVYSFRSATENVHHDRVRNAMHKDVKARGNFKGKMKTIAARAGVIGLLLNLGMMSLSASITTNQDIVIKLIIVAHGVLGILDFFVSYKERKVVREYYKLKRKED